MVKKAQITSVIHKYHFGFFNSSAPNGRLGREGAREREQ